MEHIRITGYREEDLERILMLFFETVHSVNAKDYTKEELWAWADSRPDRTAWDASLKAHKTVVAWIGKEMAGFGDMAEGGYLDRLYVRKDWIGKGVGTVICDELERGEKGPLTTYASITARPFFEKRGYRTVRENEAVRNGIILKNFLMEKQIGV